MTGPSIRRTGIAGALLAAALVVGGCTTDSTGSPAPGERPVGDPVARDVSSRGDGDLYVVRADGDASTSATEGDRFTVSLEVTDPVLAFTDRPTRGAERMTAAQLTEQWPALFAGDPPNAALSGRSDGSDVDLAVELTDPRWDPMNTTLTFTARTIGADRAVAPPATLADASLFIDDAVETAELQFTTGLTALRVTSVDTPSGDGARPPMVMFSSAVPQTGYLEAGMQLVGSGGFANIAVTNPDPGAPFVTSFVLADGDAQWTITVTFDSDGQVTGTIAQGSQDGLPPQPDPDTGWVITELEQPGIGPDFFGTAPLQFNGGVASARWN